MPNMSYAFESHGVWLKLCPQCQLIKSVDDFYHNKNSKDGHGNNCKKCDDTRTKARVKNDPLYKIGQAKRWKHYYYKHQEQMKKRAHEYYVSPEGHAHVTEYGKKRRADPRVKEYDRKRSKTHRNCPLVKKIRNEQIKKRLANDLSFKLAYRLRTAANRIIKLGYIKKSTRTIELIGCSIEDFKKHIENLWESGMSWENYGCKHNQWSFDHILCVGLFDFSYESHQKACMHYKNIRPMWHLDNIIKNDKLEDGRKAQDLNIEEKQSYLISKGYSHLFESNT